MPITFTKGDLFEAGADAIVVPVNCVGVMGKGVARQVAQRYPEVEVRYKEICRAREILPGQVRTIDRAGLTAGWAKDPKDHWQGDPRWVFLFASKNHWRNDSMLIWIERGVAALKILLDHSPVRIAAIPPVGCGNGNLDWAVVRPILEKGLDGMTTCHAVILEP